ncbi:MAG: glycosyltransferase family 2 protein [Nocardioides sp.]
MSTGRRIAYVLPVFDEARGLATFHQALVAAAAQRPDLTFEFVYVDDGSRDSSLEQLLAMRESDPRVTVLALARNFGHQVAVTAGLDAAHASGADAVIVMDTDLQDPPPVSLELIARWEAGVDVVYAQRRTRQDTRFKRGTAAGFYWVLDKMAETEIPRNVGDFRLMDRRVLNEVVKYREHNRFLRGIVAQVGYRQEAHLFDRDDRFAGESHYPLKKMLKLAADGIMGFSTRPLRFISHLGTFISGLAVLGILYVVGVRLFNPDAAVPGWAFLAVAMFFLGGVQLIVLGVIGSYVGRTYVEVLDRPLYSVALVARSASDGSVTPE